MRASAAVLAMAASSYVALLVGLLRGVLVMRLVGVVGNGLMQKVFLINRYTSNAHLGILHGLSKLLPMRVGAQAHEEAKNIEAVGMTWVVALTALAAAGMFIWGFTKPPGQEATGIALVIGAGWLLAEVTYILYRNVLRSWNEFRVVAWITVLDAFVAFVFAVYGAYRWGFAGAMLGLLAAWLIDLLMMHRYSGVRIRLLWRPRLALQLLRTGLLITLIGFSDILLRTIDGAVMIRYYDDYQFGLYSVGMRLAGMMFALPESVGFVIWPRIMEAWGAWHTFDKIRRHIQLPTMAAASVMPLLAGSAHILLPVLILILVPQFVDSIRPARILTWGGIFLALPLAANSVLVATNRETVVIGTRISCGILLGGATYWLVLHQAPITHIACAAAGAHALASLASLSFVLPNYFKGWRLLGEIAGYYVPTIWAVVSLKFATNISSNFISHNEFGYESTALRLLFFLVLYTPGIIYGNYHTELTQELLKLLRDRRQARQTEDTTDDEGDEK
jgi:O-antigen/teichoic acid export membrane protein